MNEKVMVVLGVVSWFIAAIIYFIIYKKLKKLKEKINNKEK